ncbi:MAG: hypothetical protein KDD62_08755 [Bdellovibrionales bacterium]|nr:hypothetical protein [Bdellovibrionales bacterium]
MDNTSAINTTSQTEARLTVEPRNDDKTRQVSAKRLPSFEAAFDLVTELDGLIAQRPNSFADAHLGLCKDRVRELLR